MDSIGEMKEILIIDELKMKAKELQDLYMKLPYTNDTPQRSDIYKQIKELDESINELIKLI